jgi:hypothetical protein
MFRQCFAVPLQSLKIDAIDLAEKHKDWAIINVDSGTKAAAQESGISSCEW